MSQWPVYITYYKLQAQGPRGGWELEITSWAVTRFCRPGLGAGERLHNGPKTQSANNQQKGRAQAEPVASASQSPSHIGHRRRRRAAGVPLLPPPPPIAGSPLFATPERDLETDKRSQVEARRAGLGRHPREAAE
jgi:hypothetical protein